MFSSNNKTQLSIEKNLQLYEAKNKFLYDAFDKGVITDENFIHFKAKAIELKKLADSCDKYLYHLKTNLVLGLCLSKAIIIVYRNLKTISYIQFILVFFI